MLPESKDTIDSPVDFVQVCAVSTSSFLNGHSTDIGESAERLPRSLFRDIYRVANLTRTHRLFFLHVLDDSTLHLRERPDIRNHNVDQVVWDRCGPHEHDGRLFGRDCVSSVTSDALCDVPFPD